MIRIAPPFFFFYYFQFCSALPWLLRSFFSSACYCIRWLRLGLDNYSFKITFLENSFNSFSSRLFHKHTCKSIGLPFGLQMVILPLRLTPNEAPTGFLSHFGGFCSGITFCVCCSCCWWAAWAKGSLELKESVICNKQRKKYWYFNLNFNLPILVYTWISNI